ncbi:hypothetical protein THAOC_31652, partial [Thalassiosira oceanica]
RTGEIVSKGGQQMTDACGPSREVSRDDGSSLLAILPGEGREKAGLSHDPFPRLLAGGLSALLGRSERRKGHDHQAERRSCFHFRPVDSRVWRVYLRSCNFCLFLCKKKHAKIGQRQHALPSHLLPPARTPACPAGAPPPIALESRPDNFSSTMKFCPILMSDGKPTTKAVHCTRTSRLGAELGRLERHAAWLRCGDIQRPSQLARGARGEEDTRHDGGGVSKDTRRTEKDTRPTAAAAGARGRHPRREGRRPGGQTCGARAAAPRSGRASKPSFASADRPSPISSPTVSTSASNLPTYDAKGRPMAPTEGGRPPRTPGRDEERLPAEAGVRRGEEGGAVPPPATTTLLLVLLVSTAQWTPRRHAEAVEMASASDRDGGRTASERPPAAEGEPRRAQKMGSLRLRPRRLSAPPAPAGSDCPIFASPRRRRLDLVVSLPALEGGAFLQPLWRLINYYIDGPGDCYTALGRTMAQKNQQSPKT